MEVICNSGPLMTLAKLNLLSLLKKLYDEVLIPKAVYSESVIMGKKKGYEDARTIELFLDRNNWEPKEISPEDINKELKDLNLDRGEVECLYLANSSAESPVLIDDEYARKVARRQGIKVKGTLGVLVEAFRGDLISLSDLEFYFEQIAEREDIWISAELCDKVLKEIKKEAK